MIHGPNLLRRLFHTPPYTLFPLTQWNIRLPTSSSLLMPILEDFAHFSLPPTSCTSCEVWVRSGVARLHFGSWPVLWAILFPSKAYELRSLFMFIPVILFTALGRYTFCSLKKKFLCGNSEILWNCPFSLVLVHKQTTKTSPKEPSGMCFTIQPFGPTSGSRPAKTARSKALRLVKCSARNLSSSNLIYKVLRLALYIYQNSIYRSFNNFRAKTM